MTKKWYFWIVIALITGVLFAGAIVFGTNHSLSERDDEDVVESKKEKKKNKEEDDEEGEEKSTKSKQQKKEVKKEKELSDSEKMIVLLSELLDEGLVYDSGNYVKGDITPGEYAFIKIGDSGSYYSEKDASGTIVDNENFDSFGYVKVHGVGNLETRGILVNVTAFERLGVSGAKQLYEIVNNQTNYNQSGFYKVGYDIAPGTYVVESIGSGYYAILTGPVSNNEIVDNDNFNGRAQITLRDGQYLELSRAQITQ